MGKIKLETINVWLEAIIWTFWSIAAYGAFRLAGKDILITIILVSVPIMLRKKSE